MFPLSELSKFDSEKIAVKILKPWWDVLTDYLLIFLLMVSLVVWGMQVTSASFECLPAVDCSQTMNGTWLSEIKYAKVCTVYNSSQKPTAGKPKTVVTEHKNFLQYAKYVNSECSKTSVHWFASYFGPLLFAQAFILLILDNVWLKFPSTASTIETFSALVVECYNSPGTCFGLSQVLWNIPERYQSSDVTWSRTEQNLGEMEKLLDEQQDNEDSSFDSTALSNQGKNSVDVATAVAVKTLYEKVKRFKECIKSSKWIGRLYLAQAALQALLSLAFIVIDVVNKKNVRGTVRCSLDVNIPVGHDYFTCSHNLAPVFEIALVLNLTLLTLALAIFLIILPWTIHKIFFKKQYDFEKELSQWTNSQAADVTAAEADMSFLLQLLHAYNKLYVLRFAIYMSEANEKKLKAFILENEWPLTKLEKLCEEEGRKLSLNKVSGIPQTLFDLGKLNTLYLTRCGPLQHDDFQHFGESFRLRKLVIVNCGLTKIPEQVLAMTSLEVLALKRNSIKSIPDGIGQLTNLTNMDLSNNKLETISKSFKNLNNLETLFLSNNPKLEVSAIQNVLACQKLHHLVTSPLTESQEKKLNNEEKEKYKNLVLGLRCLGTHDQI